MPRSPSRDSLSAQAVPGVPGVKDQPTKGTGELAPSGRRGLLPQGNARTGKATDNATGNATWQSDLAKRLTRDQQRAHHLGRRLSRCPGGVVRIASDQAAARGAGRGAARGAGRGAARRKAEHYPRTGRTRVIRQRGKVPCLASRTRGDPNNTPRQAPGSAPRPPTRSAAEPSGRCSPPRPSSRCSEPHRSGPENRPARLPHPPLHLLNYAARDARRAARCHG